MIARALLCGVALTAASASAGRAEEDWIGRFLPISRACQGMTLVVAPGRLSFGDCARAAYRELQTGQGRAALIDPAARACPIAGNVLTLAPDGPDAQSLSLYDSERAYREGRPKLVCAYSP